MAHDGAATSGRVPSVADRAALQDLVTAIAEIPQAELPPLGLTGRVSQETRRRALAMHVLRRRRHWTFDRIGRAFGVTRERARQLILRLEAQQAEWPRSFDDIC